MQNFRDILDQWVQHLKTVAAGNEAWRFGLSVLILGLGILALEYGRRRANRYFLDKGGEKWVSVIQGFRPSVRVAVMALLLRAAEIPLRLPADLVLLVHSFEAFLFAVASILFLFQVISLLDGVLVFLPQRIQKNISEQRVATLKTVFRILAVLLVAALFLVSQKHLFPDWFFHSSWLRYGFLAIILAGLYLGGRLLGRFLGGMVNGLGEKEEAMRVRLVFEAASRPMKILLFAIAVYAVYALISLPDAAVGLLRTAVDVLATLAVVLFVYRLLAVLEFELNRMARRKDSKLDRNIIQFIRMTSKILVVVLGAVYILQALTGKPMNAILAGLGIGGLAFALAAQDTLKNLFGSLMIMLDKPFIVGERIVAEGIDGYVEDVGFRSTRIRTFDGHLVTVPNEKMAAGNIENVGSRPSIRRVMNLTITYDTPPDKVEKALEIVREALRDHEGMHPDYPPKAFFSEFNDTSLNLLAYYWYFPPDYWKFMEFSEKVNFGIMRAFEAEGIEFAFPTTTTYLAQDDRRPLTITVEDNRLRPAGEKG
ncbi:MAG TPA: mechanosensitive ion channel family protein [Syntrophales bacterium]|nr:mechanosensitive ion channel family protein [Syntrophales bacterium]